MKIKKQNIITSQSSALKILILSDIHIYDKKSWRKIEEIKKYIQSHTYDAIFLVGDIIDSTNMLKDELMTLEKLLNFIKYLGKSAPTYIVYGSHDISSFKKHRWHSDRKTFENKFLNIISKYPGIKILENESQKIIAGYTVSGFNPSFNYAFSNNKELILMKENNFNFLKKLNINDTNILLCHYPEAIKTLANKGYLNNVDLGIAGHNHNGMTQFKYLPIENFFNFIKQPNRGIITPNKKIMLKKTNKLRGILKLNERCSLLINPSITSLSACTGFLRNFDSMFYMGATEIDFTPKRKRITKKKSC